MTRSVMSWLVFCLTLGAAGAAHADDPAARYTIVEPELLYGTATPPTSPAIREWWEKLTGEPITMVRGRVEWTDRLRGRHGLRHIDVEIWSDGDAPTRIMTTVTEEDGSFEVAIPERSAFERVFVLAVARSAGQYRVSPHRIDRPYAMRSPSRGPDSWGDIDFRTLVATERREDHVAFGVGDGVLEAGLYAYSRRLDWSETQVRYPVYRETSQTGSSSGHEEMEISYVHGLDWNNIHHECGHALQDYNHFFVGVGLSHDVTHLTLAHGKELGTAVAFNEGFANWFSVMMQRVMHTDRRAIPETGDSAYDVVRFRYAPTTISLETSDGVGPSEGEDTEWAVARILWDLFDAEVEPDDTVQLGDAKILDLLRRMPVHGSFRRLSDLWEVLAASFPVAELDAYARVFAAHGAAPRPLSGSRLREGEVLTWVRGGAAPVYRHDRFDLEIYDSRAQVLLHRVPDITVTGTADRASYTLTARDIERIVLATYTNRVGVGDLIWLVQGRHIDAVQTTGRYMSPFHRFGEGGISAEDASEILGAGRDIYR